MDRFARWLVGCALAAVLAGCATGSQPQATPTQTVTATVSPSATQSSAPEPVAWEDIDWQNGDYPAACAGSPTTSLTVADGEAVIGYDGTGMPMKFIVESPVFGTLGGDRAAAIKMFCQGANASSHGVIIVVDTPEGPRHLGYALDPEEGGKVTEMAFAEEEFFVGALTNSPEAPRCCPDIEFKYFYDLDEGGQLVLLDSYRQPRVDPDTLAAETEAQLSDEQACAQIESLTLELRSLQQQRTNLSGGSVEGIPTFSEGTFYANLSDISAINFRIMSVQRALSASRAAC